METPGRTTSTRARILLVEDDIGYRRACKIVLQKTGWEVLEASSVREATGRIGEADACLADLHLPDGSGLEVVEEARADDRAPVVVMTSRPSAEARRRALALGARRFVSKPDTSVGLVGLVRDSFRRAGEPSPKG